MALPPSCAHNDNDNDMAAACPALPCPCPALPGVFNQHPQLRHRLDTYAMAQRELQVMLEDGEVSDMS